MKRRVTHSARQAGFTLAEAIVAVCILGLVGALTFGAFGRAMAARDQAETMTHFYHSVGQAMNRMAREIQMAFISQHRDCSDPRTDTIFRGQDSFNGMRLDFTAFSHFKTRANAKESDQEELSYFVDHDPDNPGQTDLMRREQAPIDDEPTKGGVVQVLCENVTDLEFKFYNHTDDRWDDEWDTKSSDYRGRLPMFVSIEMKVKDPAGKVEKFVTKTHIFLTHELSSFNLGFIKCADD